MQSKLGHRVLRWARISCAGARRLTVIVSLGLIYLLQIVPIQSQQATKLSPVTFADVVEFVRKEGWQVNLRQMCTQLDFAIERDACVFKQVNVQETKGRGDPRGFNVPVGPHGTMTHVLVFHLSPLIGEFFVASPKGDLIKAFYRSKGTSYNLMPNQQVELEFKNDVAYWIDNFLRVKRGLELERRQER